MEGMDPSGLCLHSGGCDRLLLRALTLSCATVSSADGLGWSGGRSRHTRALSAPVETSKHSCGSDSPERCFRSYSASIRRLGDESPDHLEITPKCQKPEYLNGSIPDVCGLRTS